MPKKTDLHTIDSPTEEMHDAKTCASAPAMEDCEVSSFRHQLHHPRAETPEHCSQCGLMSDQEVAHSQSLHQKL